MDYERLDDRQFYYVEGLGSLDGFSLKKIIRAITKPIAKMGKAVEKKIIRPFASTILATAASFIPVVGPYASVAVKGAYAAKAVHKMKEAKKRQERQLAAYDQQLQSAYVTYSREAQRQGASPVSFAQFRYYVESGLV